MIRLRKWAIGASFSPFVLLLCAAINYCYVSQGPLFNRLFVLAMHVFLIEYVLLLVILLVFIILNSDMGGARRRG